MLRLFPPPIWGTSNVEMATDHVSTLGESFKLVDQIDTRRGC